MIPISINAYTIYRTKTKPVLHKMSDITVLLVTLFNKQGNVYVVLIFLEIILKMRQLGGEKIKLFKL